MEKELEKHNQQVAVVIPIYKYYLSEYEEMSLKQASTVLNEYDIVAVVPRGFLLEENNVFSKIERFEEDYFNSIADYNRLMLSVDFYECFQDYEYILIYQLDAFVFKDRLSYFCDLGYDYIGAPWLYGIFNYIDAEHSIFHVGNGGLSLRRVNSFIEILEERQPLLDEQIKNEDLFFSSIVLSTFKVAPMETALQFAFERQVKKCYELNGEELPFGCHAWERYDLSFWKPYIEEEGHVLQEYVGSFGDEDIKREAEYDCFTKLAAFFENDFDKERLKQKMENSLLGSKVLVVFGAGFYGKSFAKCIQDIGLPMKGFCDNNKELVGESLLDYPVFQVSDLDNCKDEIFVIIANLEHEDSIENQLLENGFNKRSEYITFSDFVNLLYED